MKYLKIFLVVILILGLAFVGYKGYLAYQKWEANRFSEMNMLKANQDMFLKKITDLSVTITKVVNDTAKTTTTPKIDNTYVELKDKILELQKDEEANKEEIKKLREELSIQRKAFLISDNTVLIKKDGENILLYRDTEGNLQPASEGIEKIIEHKDVSDIPIPIKEVKLDKAKSNLKAGAYYSLDKEYGVVISKGIVNIKDYSLNASLLLSDYKDLKLAVGADVGYNIGDFELGVGYSSNKDYYIKLQYSF